MLTIDPHGCGLKRLHLCHGAIGDSDPIHIIPASAIWMLPQRGPLLASTFRRSKGLAVTLIAALRIAL
ncbi:MULTISPECIES: hypothetical protein [unclassified Mesorhizobium]|uniref:hypothetical protein n=1 Tax=unclassified Mesorhizobium TaxID=325217 RepID=UPI000FCA17D5|nr:MULTISPECIES: hypothetical protein [unclassified Mesorhizobium]RUW48550.1 hypothetical protein EOA36_20500 [Mesorhizobium sp. M8A.F.Ca.ET.021.01.1.1]TGT18510.1 hypothetical protein EN856_11115 [Mesorhizobium sp. M8A.F.Ca.ET.213.01.1.1]